MRAFGLGKIVLCAVVFIMITILFSIEGQVSASTVIPGGNIINQTWTPSGSPYIIQGDVTVPPNAFLTIQAGTVVEFSSFDAQGGGLDPARVEMTISGNLGVQGTVAPVTFRAQDGTAPGTWYGIIVNPGGTANIVNALIQHAYVGLLSQTAGPGVVISNGTRFQSNQQCGVSVASGSPQLDSVYIGGDGSTGGNGSGICISGPSTPTISNALVAGNVLDGVRTESSLNVTIVNSTIHANGAVGIAASGNGALTVSNSLLTFNSKGLSKQSTNVTLTFTFNDVFGNGINYEGVAYPPGENNLYAQDPMYLRGTPPYDLHLNSSSTIKDVGTPSGAPDHDFSGECRPQGAGFDLGAFEIFVSGGCLHPPGNVSGSLNGMPSARVICRNLNTRQTVIIEQVSQSWDCKAVLNINTGDSIDVIIKGTAE